MFCPNCGMQNVDNALFCKNCGKSLKVSETTENVNEEKVEQTNYSYQPYQETEKVYSPNPVVNAIKKVASSGMVLTANILYTVATASLPLFLFIIAMTLKAQAIMLGEVYDIDALATTITIFGFIAMIPNIITLIGMWQIYAAGKNIKQPGMKVIGFTTNKIVTIIKTVLNIILYGGATFIYLIGTIIMFGFSASLDFEMEGVSGAEAEMIQALLPSIYLIVTVVLAIILIVDIILRIKTLSTIDVVKNSAIRGRKTGKVSMYLIVMLFVSGGFYCISGLVALLQLNLYPLIMGVSYILYAISLLNLREEFNKVTE